MSLLLLLSGTAAEATADKVVNGYLREAIADCYIQDLSATAHDSDTLSVSEPDADITLIRFPIPFVYNKGGDITTTIDEFLLLLNVKTVTGGPVTVDVERIIDPRTKDWSDPEPLLSSPPHLDDGWDETATYQYWSTDDNEVQQVELSYSSTPSGSFTLTADFGGGGGPEETAAITWTPDTADLRDAIETALDALTTPVADDFTVQRMENSLDNTYSKSPFWRVEFGGTIGSTNYANMTADTSSLENGSATIRSLRHGGARAWGENNMLSGTDYTTTNSVSKNISMTGSVSIDVTDMVSDAVTAAEHTVEFRISTSTSGGVVEFDSRTSTSVVPQLSCSWTESPGRPIVIPPIYIMNEDEASPQAYVASFGTSKVQEMGPVQPGEQNAEPWGWDESVLTTKLAAIPARYGLIYYDGERNQDFQFEWVQAFGKTSQPKAGRPVPCQVEEVTSQFQEHFFKSKASHSDKVTTWYPIYADPPANHPNHTTEHLLDIYVGGDMVSGISYGGRTSYAPYWIPDTSISYLEAVLGGANTVENQCGYRPLVYLWWTHRPYNKDPRYTRYTVAEMLNTLGYIKSIEVDGRSIDGILWWHGDYYYWGADGDTFNTRGYAIRREMEDDGYPDIENEPEFWSWYEAKILRQYLSPMVDLFLPTGDLSEQRHLISPGIGFSPGTTKYIVTRGMSPPIASVRSYRRRRVEA